MNILESDITTMRNGKSGEKIPKDRRHGKEVYPNHYTVEESRPHNKIEQARQAKSDEDGRRNTVNYYSQSKLSKRCNYTHNQYSCALKGHRSDLYFDMMFQFAKDLGVSIDHLVNRDSKESIYVDGERWLVARLDEMGIDERIMCLQVWVFRGDDALRRMLDGKD